MYLSRSNASRDLLRTKTGPCARRVARDPSNPHGRATSETAAKGTRAKDARRQIATAKKFLRCPLGITSGIDGLNLYFMSVVCAKCPFQHQLYSLQLRFPRPRTGYCGARVRTNSDADKL